MTLRVGPACNRRLDCSRQYTCNAHPCLLAVPTQTPGTHVFLIAVGPPLLALPPLAALVLNAGLMALTHNSDYCGTQLLTHPLSQRRLLRAAGALDIVLQPPPSAVGAVVTKSGKPVYLSLVHLPMQQNG